MRTRAVLIASVLTGVVLELLVAGLTGRREAWDSSAYWVFGIPAALAVCAALGWLSRGRAWIWTLLVVPAQVTTMMARNGEIGALWPLAAALSTVLSAPLVVAAFVGSRLRPAARRQP